MIVSFTFRNWMKSLGSRRLELIMRLYFLWRLFVRLRRSLVHNRVLQDRPFSWTPLTRALHTTHTLLTNTTHYTLHTPHYTLHTPTTHYSLHTTHYTTHTYRLFVRLRRSLVFITEYYRTDPSAGHHSHEHCTLHTTHSSLHTTHYTLHTSLHTHSHYTLLTHYTLPHTLHTPHYTLLTTLHTTHYTLHTTGCLWDSDAL